METAGDAAVRPSRGHLAGPGQEDGDEQPTIADLGAMTEVAENGIVSKSIVENEHHKIIHFTFAPGQELSEHTASVPAAIHILDGRGRVVLDGEAHEAQARDAVLHARRDAARRAGVGASRHAPDDVPDLSVAPAGQASRGAPGALPLDVPQRAYGRRSSVT